MAFRLGTAARNASVNAVTALINAGGGAGIIQIRTGSQPTNVSDAATGTLLGTLTFSSTSFANSSGGTATANTITSDTSADASGTAGHARVCDSTAAAVADADCAQGCGTFNFDNSTIVSGGTIACSSFTITRPIS